MLSFSHFPNMLMILYIYRDSRTSIFAKPSWMSNGYLPTLFVNDKACSEKST